MPETLGGGHCLRAGAPYDSGAGYNYSLFSKESFWVFGRYLPLLACIALLLSGCGGSGSSVGVSADLRAKSLPAITPPAFVPGPLDGESTPRAQALRRPLAVIVENFYPDARPQAGLNAASTVIETLAEGGVTRFMALYLEKDAATVGPVRSTRLYFDNYAAAFHAILAHVGGNDDAQQLLFHLPSVYNIDENYWEKSLYDTGTPLFSRSSARLAPHNAYTNTYKLRAYAARHGENWVYTAAAFVHKSRAPLSSRGHSSAISISFIDPLYQQSNPAYAVRYQYDRASNTYLRFMGGVPHVDAITRQQLRPANVVVIRTQGAVPDAAAGPTPQSILIPTLGTGGALFFRDGHVLHGTWQQRNQSAAFLFFDRKHRQVALDPGQTWIEVVPSSSSVSWSAR